MDFDEKGRLTDIRREPEEEEEEDEDGISAAKRG